MNPLTAQQLADILAAPVAAGDAGVRVETGVSTDTRKLSAGCAFIALRGENFDGDAFAARALEACLRSSKSMVISAKI